ncbi:MAG: CheY-like chemotaxis protein [Pseudohongiellaceae bacterium]|jgi:CheY-like chemotaxis protein
MSQALVVDDSKTSSAMLGKMLREHNIEAVNVDSAEQALEYLQSQRPTMIFMDHMMPGMDGFDAVKAIKAEPELAEIPIIMHTSKSGDIYVGHARALGAVDILSKPATDTALAEVLNRLEERAKLSVELPDVIARAATPSSNIDNTPSAIRDDGGTRSYETDSSKIASSDINWRLVSGVLLMVLMILGVFYLNAAGKRDELTVQQEDAFELIAWSSSELARFDYGELPLAAERLRLVEGLVTRLAAIGFNGVLLIKGHVGAFCLAETLIDTGERLVLLAPVDIPLSECTQIGMSEGQSAVASREQSEAFSRFVNTSPLLRRPGLRLKIEGIGSAQPLHAYPVAADTLAAGDWNTVALLNNRLEFKLISD